MTREQMYKRMAALEAFARDCTSQYGLKVNGSILAREAQNVLGKDRL